tara:strand:- start:33420 stop:34055 length:636 start_codon:yes stop_codon:yes gene_type:complete
MNPKVDLFLSKAKNWQAEMEHLRSIVLACQLTEELKWKQPCYTFQGNNILIIGAFKDYSALLFFKGSLLQDTNNILVKPGEHTQGGRQIRFTSVAEIIEKEAVLKAYIYEAVEVEKAGLKVDYKASTAYVIPEELQKKLAIDPVFKTAFGSLTPGRQRAYNLHFSGAKQSATRESRIEKYRQQILDGKGINDCTCGLSKRMPTCDGSHKYL